VGRAKKDAKRDRVTGMQEPLKIDNLYECLCSAMAFVSDEKTFDNFVQVFEAIVAYHKTVAKN
jgi:CRISPR type III-A-associated protein Csm2